MDVRKIKKLIELVTESGIAELEITDSDTQVRINRCNTQYVATAAAPQPAVHAETMPAPVPSAGTVDASAADTADDAVEGHTICSPMIGTFYSSPRPGADSFVGIGSTVKQGNTICIIEAMKIMNQIDADKDGVIVKILVENGQAVEYGQPLMIIQ